MTDKYHFFVLTYRRKNGKTGYMDICAFTEMAARQIFAAEKPGREIISVQDNGEKSQYDAWLLTREVRP